MNDVICIDPDLQIILYCELALQLRRVNVIYIKQLIKNLIKNHLHKIKSVSSSLFDNKDVLYAIGIVVELCK